VAVGVSVSVGGRVGVNVGVAVQEAATVVSAIAVCVGANPGWNTPQAINGNVHTTNIRKNGFVFTMCPSLKQQLI